MKNCPCFSGPLLLMLFAWAAGRRKAITKEHACSWEKSTLWEMKCSLSLAFSQASHQETGASGAVIGPWGGTPAMQTGPPVSWNRWCLHTHLNKAVMALARKHSTGEPSFTNDDVFLRCSEKINIYSATNFHFRHNLSSFRASHQWTAILSRLV